LNKKRSDELDLLKSRLAYLRDSFASLTDGVVILDAAGNIEWNNQAAEQLLGLNFPTDKGQPLINLVRNPQFVQYFEAKDYDEFLELSPQQNADLHLQVQISFFGQGSRLLFVRDITHTYRLQQMRRDFVANVSHELRTPLTVITGYLETLSDSSLASDVRWRRAIDQMLAQSHRMESLVRDLILLSRLESVPDAIEQNKVDVLPLLQMIAEEVRSAIKGQRTIEISCDQSISLMGHKDELRSAITNLVMNAAKYSEEGDTITVRWYADQQAAYLEVKDTGIGIADYHIPRLTERFYRVDQSRHVETGGTGLGLAIVKHVLSRHQAELNITSVLGEGSAFTCVFPLMRTVVNSDMA
jgi:two-component system phosphate regulon sensor histidine kinase PhoR